MIGCQGPFAVIAKTWWLQAFLTCVGGVAGLMRPCHQSLPFACLPAHRTAQHSTFDPNQCLALGRCEKWFQPIRTWNRASAQHSGLGSRVGGEAGGWWGQGEGRGSALKTCFTHHHCPSLRGELFHRIFNSFSSNPGFSVERFYTSWIIPGRGPSPGHDFRLHVLPDHGCS